MRFCHQNSIKTCPPKINHFLSPKIESKFGATNATKLCHQIPFENSPQNLIKISPPKSDRIYWNSHSAIMVFYICGLRILTRRGHPAAAAPTTRGTIANTSRDRIAWTKRGGDVAFHMRNVAGARSVLEIRGMFLMHVAVTPPLLMIATFCQAAATMCRVRAIAWRGSTIVQCCGTDSMRRHLESTPSRQWPSLATWTIRSCRNTSNAA